MILDQNAIRILEQAAGDICELASRVGIDGKALLSSLPESGSLLTGKHVPVLTPKDKGKASVLLHLNRSADGFVWPFLQFHTFRHGGVVEKFHGLQWLLAHRNQRFGSHGGSLRSPAIKQASANTGLDDAGRRQRDERLQFTFSRNLSVSSNLDWVKSRFEGHMSDEILSRTAGRYAGQNRMLFPMKTITGQRIGYHQIVTGKKDEKRHFVRQAGLMAGSFVRINAARSTSESMPVVICEGLATALTIALVWPGPIFAALCANNISKVRRSIHGPVILAADNDQWKTKIGNIGLEATRSACEPGDRIIVPEFSQNALLSKPTDFNDLLRLDGICLLSRQVQLSFPPSTWLRSAA